MPLGLFKHRNISTANVVGVLLAAAMFAWFFLTALYLQLVLGYSPLQVGLAFLPSSLIMGAFSLGLSAQARHAVRDQAADRWRDAVHGGRAAAVRTAPVDGSFAVDVLPGTVLLGIGAGMGFNPLLLAAMGDVEPTEAGLASGVVNTAFMMGGALGLAVLASLAASRSDNLLASGDGSADGAHRRVSRCVPRRLPVRNRRSNHRRSADPGREAGGDARRGGTGALVAVPFSE